MRGKAAGTARERQVRDWYTERDYIAFRAPASLGCADVIAMRARVANGPHDLFGWGGANVELVEVKSTAGGPYERFGPEARAKLSLAARMAGATAWLVWWPPRGQMRRIPEAEWPPAREQNRRGEAA